MLFNRIFKRPFITKPNLEIVYHPEYKYHPEFWIINFTNFLGKVVSLHNANKYTYHNGESIFNNSQVQFLSEQEAHEFV